MTEKKIATWELPLVTLRDVLSQEAMKQPGKWAMRMLPRGALVAMMLEETGKEPPQHIRFVVRIARRDAPADEEARGKWQKEVATFEKFLQLTDPPWERQDLDGGSSAAVRYVERVEGT